MRILHVVRQFSPAIGGLENFVFCLARAQRAAGNDACVLTLDSVFHSNLPKLAASDAVEGVPVRRVPWKGSYKYPIALRSAFHLEGFDVIHVHAVDFFADYLPLIRWFHKTPLVLSTHGGYFHSSYASRLKKLYFNTVTRWSMQGYKRVIACSEGDLEMFSAICKRRLTLIENGVDIEKFADLGARIHKNSFLFIGRFSNNKRIDLLLQVFSHLKNHIPDVRLTIVGRDWDGNLSRIQQQITLLHLVDQVQILIEIDDDGIKQQIANHCYIVSASDYEGFGMTLVEGMAAGLVPIASPISSFKKIIDKACVGYLVDFHAPIEAAKNILDYTQSIKSNYVAVREKAIEGAKRFGWPGTAANFTSLYEEVLGSGSRIIQGVTIDARTGSEIIAAIDSAVQLRNPLNIAIANAHTVNLARGIPSFRSLLRTFLVLNDGSGVNIASKWKYKKGFLENLNGTDFVPRLLTESSRSLRVFLLGAHPQIIEEAFMRFKQQYPNHQWVGFQDGYGAAADEGPLCARIRSLETDLVLVAMGNPLQEEWIARCSDKTGAPVHIGVGALFDFVAGKFQRAPLWVRRMKCEWVYRLALEPGRMWRRYLLGNVTFLWAAMGDRI